MIRRILTELLAVVCLFFPFPGCTDAGESPPLLRGRWTVAALTPSELVLTGDYSDLLREMYRRRMMERRRSLRRVLPVWAEEQRFHITGTEAVLQYRPALVAALRDGRHTVSGGNARRIACA